MPASCAPSIPRQRTRPASTFPQADEVAINLFNLVGPISYYGGISFDAHKCGLPYKVLFPDATAQQLQEVQDRCVRPGGACPGHRGKRRDNGAGRSLLGSKCALPCAPCCRFAKDLLDAMADVLGKVRGALGCCWSTLPGQETWRAANAPPLAHKPLATPLACSGRAGGAAEPERTRTSVWAARRQASQAGCRAPALAPMRPQPLGLPTSYPWESRQPGQPLEQATERMAGDARTERWRRRLTRVASRYLFELQPQGRGVRSVLRCATAPTS